MTQEANPTSKKEAPTPAEKIKKSLLACQLSSDVAYHDERTGNVLLHFKLICEKEVLMPSSIHLKIKTAQGEVFTGMVKMYGIKSPEHPKGSVWRTETLTLSIKKHPEIWHKSDVEITLSCGDKESIFSIYI